jgi:hypothetical protein
MTPDQAVARRLRANHLVERLPAGSFLAAARFGLQDTAPRDALVSLHARVADCPPSGWDAPGLVQTYGPRQAVYVLPQDDLATWTLGRMPRDADAAAAVEAAAEQVCRDLDGQERRGALHPDLRGACVSGRIAVRWDASSLVVREVPRPAVDLDVARAALARLHVAAFGPTTPAAFRWWSGLSTPDARASWDLVSGELAEVDLDGHRAWVLATGDDGPAEEVPPAEGVRLLPAPDLRLLGRDRTGLFAGPGLRPLDPTADTFHPGGVLVDGRVVGSWGRRGGRVDVRLSRPVAPAVREAVEVEALSLPVPGARMSVESTGP